MMITRFGLIFSIVILLACVQKTIAFPKDAPKKNPVVQSDSTFKVLIEHDIVYAEGLSHESLNSNESTTLPLKLDIYAPDNKTKKRPVFFFIHGGGFSGGTKKQERIIEWANFYASRGWVFISIDYRLKKDNGTVPQQWIDYVDQLPDPSRTKQFLAIYPVHRDAKAALRWVMANAEKYNINTDYLTVGGGSAGAITAINLGISNPNDFTDELSIEQDPTLASTNINQMYQIKTIVNLWGSKVALDVLENIDGKNRFDKNDPALFIAHGTEDPTVPFSKAEELKTIYEKNKVPLAYYPLEGKGHGAWEASVNNKNLEQLAFDFIVEQQKIKVK